MRTLPNISISGLEGSYTALITNMDVPGIYKMSMRLIDRVHGPLEDTHEWLRQKMNHISEVITAPEPTKEQMKFGDQHWTKVS